MSDKALEANVLVVLDYVALSYRNRYFVEVTDEVHFSMFFLFCVFRFISYDCIQHFARIALSLFYFRE